MGPGGGAYPTSLGTPGPGLSRLGRESQGAGGHYIFMREDRESPTQKWHWGAVGQEAGRAALGTHSPAGGRHTTRGTLTMSCWSLGSMSFTGGCPGQGWGWR